MDFIELKAKKRKMLPIDKDSKRAAWYHMPFLDFARDESGVQDYEKAAQEIFPLIERADTAFLRSQYAIAFANILGNTGEFYQYVTGSQGEQASRIEKLIITFRQNVSLLVGKTWVEATNDEIKQKMLVEVEGFIVLFESASYRKALTAFTHFVGRLAELIFGDISKDGDFLEYAFRIDPKLGLFYWYAATLGKKAAESDTISLELLRLELLIGIYFIASL
jgi:hypothetical protein